MKKLFFFLAAMALAITANAKVINGTPNPGEDGLLDWWVNGADQAGAGDTIVLADGEYLQGWSMDLEDEGLVIMAAEGAKPVIKASSYLKIHATTTFIGITFDGQNTGEHGLVIRGTDAKNLILKDCEIKNYPKCLVYCDGSYHVDSLIIDNCLLHDAGRVAVYVATSKLEGNVHGCDYFEMTNSTVYNINSTDYGAGAIDIRTNGDKQGDYTEVIVDHVTMYNVKSTGDYGAIASYKSTDVKISNTIVMNPEVYTSYSFRIYGGVVDNCLSYNCAGKSGATYNNCIEGKDPLFVNPIASDFNLQPGSPAIGAATDGTNLGDPRWKVAAAELTFAMTAPAADVEATDLYTIKWTVLDPDGDATIKLEYKAEEGDWTTIAENIPSTQSAYNWNIRHMPAQTVAIRGTLANATKSIVSEAAGKLTIVPEAVAPRPVRNLAGEVTENTLTLNWTNPDQAYEVSNTLETLESAESYISNDGTAEVTLSGDKKEVSVAYNTTAAWHMAGVKVPVTADYVNTLACELKRDAADGTQIQVTIEQNGFDWWYLIIDDIATEWTEYEFTEFEKLSWHNNSDAAVLDGTNVTAVYFATNHGSGVTGTLSLRNLTLNGAVPAVTDYAKTVVCASTTDYPTTIVAEEVVYEGAASTCTVEIDPTKDLYVSVFAQDDLGNTSVAAQYKYTAPEVEEPEYKIVEDEITNLEIDLESMCIIGGPSSQYAVDVFLILTEPNPDGTWALSAEESSVAISGVDATFIDGYAYDIDVDAPAVKVVLHVEFGGTKYELQIDMTSKPVNIEITDATIIKEEYPDGEGGTYTNWTMEGQWSDGNTTYPVLVDMSAFDPTVAEADIMVNIMVGSWMDVFYGAAEGLVHATVAENVVTLTGTLVSYTSGTWNINISAQLPKVPSALENLDTTIAPAKVIKNGQLVIIKNSVQYNAQGAVVK